MLETSDFLKDDCLIINCTIGVVVSEIHCPRLHSVQVPDSELGSHFGVLLDSMEGSDVTFDIAGEKFPAHKLVLAARSPFFKSKFFNEPDANNTEVTINDLEPKVFKVHGGLFFTCFCCSDRACTYDLFLPGFATIHV